jgi:glutaredoxin/glutathione-dependent peroxiredoxin
MSIRTGDPVPDATFTVMTADGPAPKKTSEIFNGRTVLLFAVPGAFTPTCHQKHLPGYLAEHDAIKAKGVDTIACVAVNDVFVMDAWAKANEVGDRILMLADGNAEFAKAVGLDVDLGRFGLGVRSNRYSMVVVNGIVRGLNIEQPGKLEVSTAANALCQL